MTMRAVVVVVVVVMMHAPWPDLLGKAHNKEAIYPNRYSSKE